MPVWKPFFVDLLFQFYSTLVRLVFASKNVTYILSNWNCYNNFIPLWWFFSVKILNILSNYIVLDFLLSTNISFFVLQYKWALESVTCLALNTRLGCLKSGLADDSEQVTSQIRPVDISSWQVGTDEQLKVVARSKLLRKSKQFLLFVNSSRQPRIILSFIAELLIDVSSWQVNTVHQNLKICCSLKKVFLVHLLIIYTKEVKNRF